MKKLLNTLFDGGIILLYVSELLVGLIVSLPVMAVIYLWRMAIKGEELKGTDAEVPDNSC